MRTFLLTLGLLCLFFFVQSCTTPVNNTEKENVVLDGSEKKVDEATQEKKTLEEILEKSPEKTPEKTVEKSPDVTVSNLTYHKDIRAIVEMKCQNCHLTGGIAPMTFNSFKEVFASKDSIHAAVKDKRMPPWKADNTCDEYQGNFSLTDSEKEKLLTWIQEGAKEGNASDYVAPTKELEAKLPRVDKTLTIPSYNPIKKPDDYRCFVLKWDEAKDKYLTGFRMKPGNQSIVHHIIAYYAQPKSASYYDKRNSNDPAKPGYSCFGGVNGLWLGVWAPGGRTNIFPKGTGIKMEVGSRVIIQVHYNVLQSAPAPDQTSMEMMLEDTVEKDAIMFPYTDYSWQNNNQMKIPAGQSNVKHEYFTDVVSLLKAKFGISSITLYETMLHMHVLGKSASLFLKNPDGTEDCLLNIPKWDFNWQDAYRFKTEKVIKPGYSIGIRCTYDNSAGNQPIIDGVKQTTQDVYWGDGTRDEMCLGVLYFTCQGADGKNIDCPRSL